MLDFITDFLIARGVTADTALILARAIAFTTVIVLSVIANFVARRYILSAMTFFIKRTKTTWDDTIIRRKVLNKLAHLAPALVIYVLAPVALQGADALIVFTRDACLFYMILVGILVIDSLLNAGYDVYQTFEISREIPIKSFVQVLKIIIYCVAGIFLISIILNKTPVYFLSGLGALTAVIMLIFKDAILGFVAGIQLTANKLVKHGDWIQMPKYGADGDVVEVNLTTVKVQNFDKTITTVPTYALISESFKNWRGMKEAGGRRIKRAINIDLNTIKFCDEEMLIRFRKIQYISEHIEKKRKEVEEFNRQHRVDDASLANGRRLTNIGTFRAYVTAYLRNHPRINQNLTFLIRQLKPTEYGLPIEIYVFANDTVWANYEGIQADIFDHILAVVPEFDLRVFQNPSGSDFRDFAKGSNGAIGSRETEKSYVEQD